ncbi:heparinase II/III family protein [Schleiferilactobacillus perolens]|uniref:heparinase II/III family protein n=1 Tax=Schleiferilactobacillus perolens TaxID=100468 RepID=UPI0023535825|nr:heparinase II/III family protein [Schleiferilactobacillus perolens]MCI2171081.1 heparinase II/III family protein [Schleiferilactobacillus perolens]
MATWPQYIQHLAQQHHLSPNARVNADRLLQHQYLFDSPYAMEPTQVTYTEETLDWHHTPNGDPEWLYMLKRQEYLLDLLEAYEETGNQDYQQRMKALLFSWIDHNLDDPSTWRTIDTGIRLLNWTSVVTALVANGQLNATERHRIEAAVVAQAEYLHDNYTEKFDISNWGVLITTGILTYAAAFPRVIERAVVEWAQTRFETELDLQVDGQGLQWEQSPLYLLEVWRSTLAVIAAQQAHDVPVAAIVREKAAAMHRGIVHDLKPDGTLLQQGDTDAIRIDSLYNASAAILHLPSALQQQLDPIYDYVLLEMAHEQWPDPADGQAELPRELVAPVSGNTMWRSHWSTDADYWHTYNGSLGSGHGHAALGHVDLVINGHDVIVDPGRYTYVDGTERRFLKSPAAHNTQLLDARPFSLPHDSWKYQYVSTPVSNEVVQFGSDGRLVKMTYLDQSGTVPAVVTRYWVSLAAAQVWLAIDTVHAAGTHEWHHYWQVAPDRRVTQQEDHFVLGQDVILATTTPDAWPSQTLYSPQYNDLQHLTRLETSTEFTNFGITATVFAPTVNYQGMQVVAPRQSGEDKPAAPQLAWGIRVDLQDGTNYLVTLQPENTIVGRKLYWFDGTEAYGALNVFKRQGQQVQQHDQLL